MVLVVEMRCKRIIIQRRATPCVMNERHRLRPVSAIYFNNNN